MSLLIICSSRSKHLLAHSSLLQCCSKRTDIRYLTRQAPIGFRLSSRIRQGRTRFADRRAIWCRRWRSAFYGRRRCPCRGWNLFQVVRWCPTFCAVLLHQPPATTIVVLLDDIDHFVFDKSHLSSLGRVERIQHLPTWLGRRGRRRRWSGS